MFDILGLGEYAGDHIPEAVAEEEGQDHHQQGCMILCKL